MLSTWLTKEWGLTLPIIGAPISPFAGGRLAAAVSSAGGLGLIGVASRQTVEQLERDVDEARAHAGDKPIGIGLMVWAIEARPELLAAALAARPFAIALSFGDPSPYVARVHAAGARVLSQVQDGASARAADAAGVDVVVAQGTEAGGHTGSVGTLPLVQIVCGSVRAPVVAAGGIASGAGLAAVLAAGAQGAWIGTPLMAAQEARITAKAREAVLAASETQTVHTRVFDIVQGIGWPARFPGRALANAFTARWHGRESDLVTADEARREFEAARLAEDYSTAVIYAGQSVGLVDRARPAAAIVRAICDDAEARLRAVASIVA